ncbi:MAG: nuclear transport factor 2 family protein [Vicinamibacterales bacterium]
MRTRTGLAIAVMLTLVCGLSVSRVSAAKTVLTAQDYIDIQQLYARYAMTIDSGDAEGWANTFTPDGVFNNSSRGHDALVQFVHDWREKRSGAERRHWNSNLVITPSEDGATGSVYLLLLDIGVRPPVPNMSAVHEDHLVKTPQGWRFKTRVLHSDPGKKVSQ